MTPKLSQSILDAWAAQEAQYGLPRGTLLAMAGVESSYGQNMGPSPAGAVGWHQWMPAARERFGVDPFDPVSSGQGVAQYLDANRQYLTNALGREPTFTELLTSFHSGEGNVANGTLGPRGREYAGLVQSRMPEWDVSPQQPQPPFGGFNTVARQQQPSLMDALTQFIGEASPGGALNPEMLDLAGDVLRGASYLPYRLAGAPADIGLMFAQPFGLLQGDPASYVGTSDWIIDQMANIGLAGNRNDSPGQFIGDIVSGLLDPNVLATSGMKAAPLMLGAIGKPYRGWKMGDKLEGFVDVPEMTKALKDMQPIGQELLDDFARASINAGSSPEFVKQATRKFKAYNKNISAGTNRTVVLDDESTAAVHDFVDDVVMRIGVLNTPAVSGERFDRVRAVMKGIARGDASVTVPDLQTGAPIKIVIPKNIRGKQVREFYNLPITDPALAQPRPNGFDFPVVVTGNPHLTNFRRPHPSWDDVITTVRVKPVLGGNEKVQDAVGGAINYAHEIGAMPLVTTFRSKSLPELNKYTNLVPSKPIDPDFNRYWVPNISKERISNLPKAQQREYADIRKNWGKMSPVQLSKADKRLRELFSPEDARKKPDFTPYAPTDITRQRFRESGWDIEKNIDELGGTGTWWWPRSRELDAPVVARINDKTGKIEYCDLQGKGCTSCRNCQKTTYPEAKGAQIMGCTDEPFCSMSCPQCFVRRGQSGVEGRGKISLGANAKQSGFGEADLGDTYKQSLGLLGEAAKPLDAPSQYIGRFLSVPLSEKIDMAASLYSSGKIGLPEFMIMLQEIRKGQ